MNILSSPGFFLLPCMLIIPLLSGYAAEPAARKALVDQTVAPLVDGPQALRGLVVGVVLAGKKETWGYGRAGARNNVPDGDTLFRVASATKPITGLLLAQLVMEGTLGYEDVAISFQDRPVTYRQLVTHTSGLPVHLPGRSGESLESFRQALTIFELPRMPGGRFEYSTAGYGVLGLRLGEKSGAGSFEAAVTEKVLLPLGMRATTFALDEAAEARFAGETPPPRHARGPNPFNASGGLISSAGDLLQLIAVNLDPASQPSLAPAIRLTQQRCMEIRQTFPGSGAALGWFTFGPTGSLYYFSGVATGFRSFMAFDLEANCGVVMLTNTDLAPHEPRLEMVGFSLLFALASAGK